MDNLYLQTLRNMETALRVFEKRVPPPKSMKLGDGYVFRYVEQSVKQAIIQKCARIVSGLHTARILLAHGFVQELGALQRMLDEFQEDVMFLSQGVINGDLTDLHKRYLDAFYMEEFDKPEDPLASKQKRPMIPRKKIRAYLTKLDGAEIDPYRGAELSRTLGSAYSGFVHGASPHIMDMYGGDPPKFHVSGMFETPRIDEHRDDLWNYFYRGIMAFSFAAHAFEDEGLVLNFKEYKDHFEAVSGKKFDKREQL